MDEKETTKQNIKGIFSFKIKFKFGSFV